MAAFFNRFNFFVNFCKHSTQFRGNSFFGNGVVFGTPKIIKMFYFFCYL